ncbi:MAG: cell division protein FtsQ/DivIB [Candidatus Nanopelagicales bacterium]
MSAPTIDKPLATVDFRDRSGRRRRLLRALVILLIVGLSAAMLWVVGFSPVLAAKEVRVVGVEGVAADQVRSVAAIPVGVPLARVDTGRAQAEVLALPWVATAEIRRGWPSEVVIAVEARVAIAAVAGTADAVDASGAVFTPLGPLDSALPRVRATGVGLATAMAVLSGLPDGLAKRVATVTATTRDDVELTLRSGALVRWGSADQGAFKAGVLRALLRDNVDMYDVSAPELPTTFRFR